MEPYSPICPSGFPIHLSDHHERDHTIFLCKLPTSGGSPWKGNLTKKYYLETPDELRPSKILDYVNEMQTLVIPLQCSNQAYQPATCNPIQNLETTVLTQ